MLPHWIAITRLMAARHFMIQVGATFPKSFKKAFLLLIQCEGFLRRKMDFHISGWLISCGLGTYGIIDYALKGKYRLASSYRYRISDNTNIKIGLACGAIAVFILFLGIILKNLNTGSPDLDSFLTYFFRTSILYSVFLAPIVEEFTFRYLILDRLFGKKFKFYISNLVISLIFGLIHLYPFVQSLHLYILSFIFGLIYRKYGLASSISAHFFANLLIVIIAFILMVTK